MTTSKLLNLKSGDALVADIGDLTATAAELNQLSGTTLTAGLGLVKQTQTIARAGFTDGGAAVGTVATSMTIPIGAYVLHAACTALTGFTGDTSAVLTVGDGTDVDRYNTGSIDVFTTAANGLHIGQPSGVRYHDTAKTVTLTVTSAADFTNVSAGSITIEVFYLT